MTVTFPPSRPHAERRRSVSRARAFGAWSISVLLAVSVGLIAAPAAAEVEDDVTDRTAFTLSPVANGIVRPGDSLAVSVALHNGDAMATAPVDVTLSLGGEPLRDRGALSRWLAGDTSGVPLSEVASTPLEAVLPGDDLVKGIIIPPDDEVLEGRAAGVYPLVATYESRSGPVESTSALIVPTTNDTKVGIGVVVPITAPVSSEGLLTAAQLVELTSPTGSLTAQLDAVDGTAAILAVDPAIAAAIRVLGSSAPSSATEWLDRLEALPNSRFALQFGDADVGIQLQAGLARPLGPLSLTAYIDPVNFEPDADATPTPSAGADDDGAPDETVVPSLSELTDIGPARSGVYWPADQTATADVVDSLGGIRVDDRESLTLVSSSATPAGASAATVPARSVAGDAALLVYDADISRELHEASTTETPALRGAPLTAAAAYLAFAVSETGGAPLMVTVDRDPDRSRVGLRTAITSATQAPGVSPMSLGAVASRLPSSVEIADADADAARLAAASDLLADQSELSRFATILDDATLLTGPERAEILQLFAVGWIPDPLEWQAAVAAQRSTTEATLDSVGILPPSPINLFTAGAPIPIWVRNELPYPANVVLFAMPDDLRLDIAQATEAIAGAQSNTRVQVPVQARVGNGEVSVALQLRSRTLEPIGDPQVVDVNVRADWEGFGLGVLIALIGGFILLGAVRTVLRLRRGSRRNTDASTDAADREPADTSAATPGDADDEVTT